MIRISFHLLICLTWTWFRDTEFSLMTEDKGILSDIENLAKVVFLCVFSSVRVWAPDPRFSLHVFYFFFFFFFCPHLLTFTSRGDFRVIHFFLLLFSFSSEDLC